MKISLRLTTLLSLLFTLLSIEVHAGRAVRHSGDKADFILKIADNLYYKETAHAEAYKIGVFGKSKDAKELADDLEELTKNVNIHGKPVKILNFKRVKGIKPVDLLYVKGDSKIRISDLNEKLAEYPYIIVTENFPYGTSLLNFTMNDNEDLFYELQEDALLEKGATIKSSLIENSNRVHDEDDWESKLAEALNKIEEKEKTIDTQNDKIGAQNETIDAQGQKIGEHKHTIDEQSDVIEAKERLISYQKTLITVGIISLLSISGLGFWLYRMSLQRKAALDQVSEKNKNIVDSINYAKRIQDAMMPASRILNKHLKNCFVLYRPKDIVAGDFYWMENENDITYFAVADCTGHGVPGAMLSVACNSALSKALREKGKKDPASILDETVKILEDVFSKSEETLQDGMDVALCSINAQNQLTYAGANNPLYLVQDGNVEKIKANRQPIGKHDDLKPFVNHKFDLKKGDSIYLFSDGYVDQFGGPDDKKFGHKQFRSLLLEINQQTMMSQESTLDKRLITWQGSEPQIDDVCVMGVKI